MKKSILALALIATVFASCKKEDTKPVTEDVLEEVILEEVAYTNKLEWTAYKTPEKIGVNGTFNTIEVSGVKDSGIVDQDYTGSTFKITTSSVNTKDAGRDDKLKAGFFALLAGDINGKFVSFENGKAVVELTMNDVTKTKDFTYTVVDNVLKMNGEIDIIEDFNGTKAFNSIHELCKELHMDKTWTQVTLNVEIAKK